MEQESLTRHRPSPARAALVSLGLALAVIAGGCGGDDDRARSDAPGRSTTTTTVATTTTAVAAAEAPTMSAAPPPTTAAPTTLPAEQAAALDQELASIGSSLDAADAANRQADPGLARQQEGNAP